MRFKHKLSLLPAAAPENISGAHANLNRLGGVYCVDAQMETELLSDERKLIAAAQTGDCAAFCVLARRYERRIYSLALHYCRDAHEAEDLTQEVWLRVFRALADFRGDASFYTWLRRITMHAFLNHRRGPAGRVTTATRDLSQAEVDAHNNSPAHARATETALHDRLLVAQVLAALGELPAQQRLIFLLKHNEGMTYEEIARALDCAPGTVKKALFRAVAKLRTRLCVQDERAAEATGLAPCVAGEKF